eukprot:5610538-Prymnesium_polylepis.1
MRGTARFRFTWWASESSKFSQIISSGSGAGAIETWVRCDVDDLGRGTCRGGGEGVGGARGVGRTPPPSALFFLLSRGPRGECGE